MSVLYLKPSSHFPSYLKFRIPYSDYALPTFQIFSHSSPHPLCFCHMFSLFPSPPSLNHLFCLLQTLLFLIMIRLDASFHSDHNFHVLSLERRLTFISLLHSLLENDLIKNPLIVWFPCWLVRWLVSSFLSLPTSSMKEGLCVSPFLLCSPCPYPFC